MNKQDILDKIGSLGLIVAYTSGNDVYIECPFHADRRPSLAISLKGKGWFCFSCEKGGSLDDLKRMIDGMEKENNKIGKKTEQKIQEETIRLSHMAIEDYFELKLAVNCKYLNNRGFTNDTIKYWNIRKSEIFSVIPVFKRKEVCGLILRVMLKDYKPRYQYSKGFDKKNALFGSWNCKRGSMLIVTEGALDCIMTWQNGYKNVSAILGSSISNGQIKEIKKISGRVMLLLDNDDAGKEALLRAGDVLSEQVELFVPDYNLYKSKDPGEMKSEELDNIINNPIPFVKMKLSSERISRKTSFLLN